MDSPTERMPIACVHCAKAKAKCDKKVPCSRCVGKQIVCQSRATRRSSQNPNRRAQLPRSNSDRPIHATNGLQVPQPLAQYATPATADPPLLSPNELSPRGLACHSMPDLTRPLPPVQLIPNTSGSDIEHQMLRNTFGHTPPDLNFPITPLMTSISQMDVFLPMNGHHYDSEADSQFLSLENTNNPFADFDAANILTEFMSPPSFTQDTNDHYFITGKGGAQTPNQMLMSAPGPAGLDHQLEVDMSSQHLPPRSYSGHSSLSSGSSVGAIQEADAIIEAHQAWPFFQCNRLEKLSFVPPKTANIHLEGLAQALRSQATWHTWVAQINDSSLEVPTERTIFTEPISGWTREKLLAITQGFLHKALDTHKVAHAPGNVSPSYSTAVHEAFLMLPPPEVIQYLLRSYVVRYEPYYSSISGARLDPNKLMLSTSSKAASLLILLMLAAGATATARPEARFIASGLTEACRISLFDTVEKDVSQAREVLVLRSALLFTCLAAWSGDKWHMDMAMGQRGMYLAMLAHAGMLESSNSHIDLRACKVNGSRAWEEWKQHEGRQRLTHSWIIVDQEMSLFSDTTPLLSVVDLHVSMPDSDDLWHADTAGEWLTLFEKVHETTYRSPDSVRDFFTRLVDGDLAKSELSPTQLRLLLHPLQGQVCQLRQLIACLPDGGNHHKTSRAVSKAATKARLEEISALLQQWYAISKQSFSGNKGTCWTTCANLIMYHLISLNAISSFKCIEQFARREKNLSPSRYASWLQTRCVDQPEGAYFHCGQILRLIRSMPKAVRPPWWSGAIYRVALTGWATSLCHAGFSFPGAENISETQTHFAIDALTPEHELISRYLKYQEGWPMLTGLDGDLLPVSVPSNVLRHCIHVLEDDPSTRLTDGIKRKLTDFMDQWKGT